jgi:putative methionine-R-sulfoxide reductase with GAF domain
VKGETFNARKGKIEVNMASTREEDKPWKTDLARKSALRRESVLHEVEEAIKKAGSFEDALKQSVEIMKKRFGRYSAITAYVADGEDLAVHTSLERPAGPDRIWSGGGPLADAAHGHVTTKVADLASQPLWAAVGLATGSVMVGPVRREAGLWAVLEVWSDFRDAFTPHDVKMMDKVVAALAKKTPAA